MGRDVHGDAFALVGGAQRTVGRRVDDRIDNAAALQLGRHLELAVGRTLPVEIERAHQRTDRSRRRCDERAPRQDGEALVGERKVRIVVALASRAPPRAVRGRLARIVGEAARMAVVVQQLRAGSVDAALAGLLEAEAVVDVVVRDREALAVEPAVLEEDASRRQHAGRGHRAVVARHGEIREVAVIGLGRELEGGPGQAVVIAVEDPGVLDVAVGIEEPRADRADARQLRVAHHRRQPARLADLGVVVQEQQIIGVDARAAATLLTCANEKRGPGFATRSTRCGSPRDTRTSRDRRSRCRRRRSRSCGRSSAASESRQRASTSRDGSASGSAARRAGRRRGTRGGRGRGPRVPPTPAAPRGRGCRDARAPRRRRAARRRSSPASPRRGRRRPRRRAPVVEHERQVDDAARALARAEREVVVLRALETRRGSRSSAPNSVRRTTKACEKYMYDSRSSGDQSGLNCGA